MGNRHGYYDVYERIPGHGHFSDGINASFSDSLRGVKTGRKPLGSRVTLRSAVISDSLFIGSLSRDVFTNYGPYEDILLAWFKSGNAAITIIACTDEKQTGFAMLSEPSHMYDLQDVSELLGIAVEPEKQGKGIGELLLRAIEIKSASLNIQWVFLHTAVDNAQARRLYERTGYSNLEIKKRFYPAGQDAIVMYKAVKRVF